MCVAVLYGAWMYEGVNRMSVKPTDAVELFEDHNGVVPFHLDEPDPSVRRRREREDERRWRKGSKTCFFLSCILC